MSKVIAIIPARYESSRLPGKVLEKIGNKTMLQLVYEQVKKVTIVDEIVIATDDNRVIQAAKDFGAQAEMTFASHRSGTDRCAQVAQEFWEDDIIINVQADEPFINPEVIELLANTMLEDSWIEIATLCTKAEASELQDPNVVKLVKANNNFALYFSRSKIPYDRDGNSFDEYCKHAGLYAYRNKILQSITKLPESSLEKAEKLEQLRWLQNGYKIYVVKTNYNSLAVDTLDDLQKARELYGKL